MSKSLQDQLLNAGLVDSKKAKAVSKQKRKQKNVERRNKDASISEEQQAMLDQQQAKKARDRELNLQRQAEADKKALAAQIIQIVEHYQLKKTSGDIEYHFSDNSKIKKLYVTQEVSDELSRGRLCIARLRDRYAVVPKPIADKIRERDDTAIVLQNDSSQQATEEHEAGSDEEYYAQFEIPDDLTW